MSASSSSIDWTLLQLLNWTTEYFTQAGIEDARLNAEYLLSEAAGLDRVMLYARFETSLSSPARKRFREMVARRARRCPIQYVLGHTAFYGRDFEVDRSVMVPRQETELLIDRCLELLPADASRSVGADIGTGSGIIAVTLACERKEMVCFATDLSPQALEKARANACLHGVEERISFREGDLLSALSTPFAPGEHGLDIVVSNPPYIPCEDIKDLQPEVGQWEPRLALDGGRDGMNVIRRLTESAPDALKPGGWLVMELGEGQADEIRALIQSMPQWCDESLNIMRDNSGIERVVSVQTERPCPVRPPT